MLNKLRIDNLDGSIKVTINNYNIAYKKKSDSYITDGLFKFDKWL